MSNGLWERTKEKIFKQPSNGKNAEEYAKQSPPSKTFGETFKEKAITTRKQQLQDVMKEIK